MMLRARSARVPLLAARSPSTSASAVSPGSVISISLLAVVAAFLLAQLAESGPVGLQPRLTAGPWLLEATPDHVLVRWEARHVASQELRFKASGSAEERTLAAARVDEQNPKLPVRGDLYEARISGLAACATYSYRIHGLEPEGTWHAFTAAPRPGEVCGQASRLLFYSDTRSGHEHHAAIVKSALALTPQLLLHGGDAIDYANRTEEWYTFFGLEKRLLPTAPLVVVPGNHEEWGDAQMGMDYLRRFFGSTQYPGLGSFAFEWGPAFIVVVDVHFPVAPVEEEIAEWVQKQFAAAGRGRFKLLVLHEPVYTLGSVHHVEDHFAALQEPLVDLGVDAALAGHAHLYEHFLFGATHFVTIGGGGAELHEAAAQAQELPEVAKHLVKTKSDYEYLIVDFSLDRARFTVYTEDGRSVLDEWTIEKPREQ